MNCLAYLSSYSVSIIERRFQRRFFSLSEVMEFVCEKRCIMLDGTLFVIIVLMKLIVTMKSRNPHRRK